jgi:hypothetical protein
MGNPEIDRAMQKIGLIKYSKRQRKLASEQPVWRPETQGTENGFIHTVASAR